MAVFSAGRAVRGLVYMVMALLAAIPALAADPVQNPGEAAPTLVLTTPGTVSDGEAFLCTASAPGAVSFTFEFRGRKVTVPALQQGDGRSDAEVLLSVPLDYKEATALVRCTTNGPGQPQMARRMAESTVSVVRKKYPVQELTVAPKYVAPPASEADRIARERAASGKALGIVSPVRYWTLPLLRPVPGIVTSDYGMRRVFNKTPMAPHRGLDLRGAEGTPILAAAKGRVVLSGDYYYAGNNVVLDHGLGALTHYMHLSRILVSDGQMVERGETIGLVGSTGRVTGPHLHLGLTVQGTPVNILPLLEEPERAAGAPKQ